MSYFKIIEGLINELEENELISLKVMELAEGVGKEYIEDVVSDAGLDLNREIINFYDEVDYVNIEWEVTETAGIKYFNGLKEPISGTINILPFETCLYGYDRSKGWKDIIWFDFMKEEIKNEYKKIRPFDFYFNDSQECVSFMMEGNKVSNKMSIYGLEIGLNEINIGIEEYIRLLAEYKGMLFWTHRFLNRGKNEESKINYYIDQLFNK